MSITKTKKSYRTKSSSKSKSSTKSSTKSKSRSEYKSKSKSRTNARKHFSKSTKNMRGGKELKIPNSSPPRPLSSSPPSPPSSPRSSVKNPYFQSRAPHLKRALPIPNSTKNPNAFKAYVEEAKAASRAASVQVQNRFYIPSTLV